MYARLMTEPNQRTQKRIRGGQRDNKNAKKAPAWISYPLLSRDNLDQFLRDVIKATIEDVEEGFQLYRQISQANELGLSPFVWNIYDKLIRPLTVQNEVGVDNKTVAQEYLRLFHKPLSRKVLNDVSEQLENAGLIIREVDPLDRRKTLIFSPTPKQEYVRRDSGVNSHLSNQKTLQDAETYPPVPGNISSDDPSRSARVTTS
jgi:hypothetical protein